MRLREAIKRADELRPNVIPEERKASWLCELDGRVAEIMDVEPPASPWPEDGALLMPAPYDNIYELYLCAMIDLASQETTLYANDMVVYNAAMNEARAWWRRNHRPEPAGNWRVM